jgi:hypothetical protein
MEEKDHNETGRKYMSALIGYARKLTGITELLEVPENPDQFPTHANFYATILIIVPYNTARVRGIALKSIA